jgi:hypothetical protein
MSVEGLGLRAASKGDIVSITRAGYVAGPMPGRPRPMMAKAPAPAGFGAPPPPPAGYAPPVRDALAADDEDEQAEESPAPFADGGILHDAPAPVEGVAYPASESAREEPEPRKERRETPRRERTVRTAVLGQARRVTRGVERLRGKRLASRSGELTVEVVAPMALEWQAGAIVLVLGDGREIAATLVEERTTRAGTIAKGLVIRLTVVCSEPTASVHTLRVDSDVLTLIIELG